MSTKASTEKEAWDKVTHLMGQGQKVLGPHWSFHIYNDPKRLPLVLSRYKFAARLATKGKRVLELGCSEGLGGRILGEFARSYTGIDLDEGAVAVARRNLPGETYNFVAGKFLGQRLGTFDTVVCIDITEHVDPTLEHQFFRTCYENLDQDGICIIGTPNMTAPAYASPAGREGHVSLFDGERLKAALQEYFHNVFLFGLNDELVHAGFTPMDHFLIAVGVYKRAEVIA
jgi:2-polyprenyl-3-methyl-5-hydroxy-6-metoxy-1,4-benzoquinol methylase